MAVKPVLQSAKPVLYHKTGFMAEILVYQIITQTTCCNTYPNSYWNYNISL